MDVIESKEPSNDYTNSQNRTTNILLIIIVVLLVAQISIPLLQPQPDYSEQIEIQMAVISIMAENAEEIIDQYQDVAYGPRVDRIAEQQLLATETTNDLLGQFMQQLDAFSLLIGSIQGIPAEE